MTLFERIEEIIEVKINQKVTSNLRKTFKDYNITLTSSGELIILDEFYRTIEKKELQQKFQLEVEGERSKAVLKIATILDSDLGKIC